MFTIVLVIAVLTGTLAFIVYYYDCISKSLNDKKLRREDVKSLVYGKKSQQSKPKAAAKVQVAKSKKNKRGKNNRKNQYQKLAQLAKKLDDKKAQDQPKKQIEKAPKKSYQAPKKNAQQAQKKQEKPANQQQKNVQKKQSYQPQKKQAQKKQEKQSYQPQKKQEKPSYQPQKKDTYGKQEKPSYQPQKKETYGKQEKPSYQPQKKDTYGKQNKKQGAYGKQNHKNQNVYGKQEYGKQNVYGKKEEYGNQYGHVETQTYGKPSYGQDVYGKKKSECGQNGCIRPEFTFCNTQSCFEEDKCGKICGIKCASGPYINGNCVPCPDLVTRVASVIGDLDCTKEKIVEQFTKGQCSKALNMRIAYLEELRNFVNLFDAIKLDDQGKKIMLCHFTDLERSYFDYVNHRVQRQTVKIDCEEERREWLKKNKLKLDKLSLALKEEEDELASTFHTILPTLGTSEEIKEYIRGMGTKLVSIALLELKCEDKSMEIMDIMRERRDMREEFAQKLARAMACTTCNG